VPWTLSRINDRSFTAAGPRRWNNLSVELQQRNARFEQFKRLTLRRTVTFLFNCAGYNYSLVCLHWAPDDQKRTFSVLCFSPTYWLTQALTTLVGDDVVNAWSLALTNVGRSGVNRARRAELTGICSTGHSARLITRIAVRSGTLATQGQLRRISRHTNDKNIAQLQSWRYNATIPSVQLNMKNENQKMFSRYLVHCITFNTNWHGRRSVSIQIYQ